MNITNNNTNNNNNNNNNCNNHYANDLISKSTTNIQISTRQKIPLKTIAVNNESKLSKEVNEQQQQQHQYQNDLLNVLYPIHVKRSSDGEINHVNKASTTSTTTTTTIKSSHLSFLSTNSQIFKPPPNVSLFSNTNTIKKHTSKKK
jgi:hypothetical protein